MNEQHNDSQNQGQMNQPYSANPHQQYGNNSKRRNPNLPYKSPGLASFFSCFPGMGQAYVGYYQQGFLYVLIMAMCITALSLGILPQFIGPMLAFFWIFNLIDANRRAQHFNRALDGMQETDVPPDFEMPSLKGSMPMGLLLIAFGILIILDLNYGISLEWMENWWPLGLVGFGGWLIFKSRQKAN